MCPVSGWQGNPTLSVTPQYVANAAMGTPSWVVTSALDWPIETAGKRGRRIDRAEQLATAARLSLDTAAWKVRANLRARLLDFVAARRRLELLAREHDAQHEVVALLEQRVQVGAASVAELAPARLAELQRVADLAEAERQQREARVRLATAVGVPVRALDGLDLEFPLDGRAAALDRLTADELRREALLRRPDVLASLAEYGASQSALQLEIARQYPDVRIGPGYEYDQGLNKWAVIGVSLELPVLNRNAGPIGEAKARRTEAAARFAELQATVIDELDRALANRDSSREALRRSEAVLAAERERLASTTRAFDAGRADRLALRTAEVDAIRAERIHLDAQVRVRASARRPRGSRAAPARNGTGARARIWVAARTGDALKLTLFGVGLGAVTGALAVWLVLSRPGAGPSGEAPLRESGDASAAAAVQRGPGDVTIRLDAATRERIGLQVAPLAAIEMPDVVLGFGRLLEPSTLAAPVDDREAARAAFEAAEGEYRRVQTLQRGNSNASQRDLEVARAAFERDRAAFRAAEARLGSVWGREAKERRDLSVLVQSLVAREAAVARIDLPLGTVLSGRPRAVAWRRWWTRAPAPSRRRCWAPHRTPTRPFRAAASSS